MLPETRYAKSGDVHIAYQVIGKGPFDLVFVPGFISHVDHVWDELADWRGVGNGLARAAFSNRAPKPRVTRSNRVGCARKACAESAGTVAGQPLKAGRERQRFSQSESLG
jgi:hypothetical protein